MVEETVAVDNQQVQQPVAEVVEQPKTEYQKNEQAAENYIQNKVGEYEGVKPDLGFVSQLPEGQERNDKLTLNILKTDIKKRASELKKRESVQRSSRQPNYRELESIREQRKGLEAEAREVDKKRKELFFEEIDRLEQDKDSYDVYTLSSASEFVSELGNDELRNEYKGFLETKIKDVVDKNKKQLEELTDLTEDGTYIMSSTAEQQIKNEIFTAKSNGATEEELKTLLENLQEEYSKAVSESFNNLALAGAANFNVNNPKQTYLEANAKTVWNQSVGNVPALVGHLAKTLDVMTSPIDFAATIAMGEGSIADKAKVVGTLMNTPDVTEKIREKDKTAYNNALDNVYDDLNKLSEEMSYYIDPRQDTFVGGVVGNVIQMSLLPAGISTVAPRLARGLSLGLGYTLTADNVYKEAIKNGLSEAEAMAVSSAIGAGVGLLERYSFDEVLNIIKGTKAAKDLAAKNISIDQLFNKSVKEFSDADFVLGLSTVAAIEGGTEAIQYSFEDASKRFVNELKDEKIFEVAQNLDQYGEQMWENFLGGTLGGSLFYGAAKFVNKIFGNKETTDFSEIKQVLNSEEQLNKFNAQVDALVKKGVFTPEYGSRQKNTAQIIFETKSSIVNGLTETQAKKAFELIFEKKQIEQEIEGKDKALVQNELERIKNIDEELANVRNIKEEPKTEEQKPQEESKQERLQTEEESKQSNTEAKRAEVEKLKRETENKIKRKDLFSDGGIFANELGGSGVNSVPTNHREINGIEFVEFSNPNTGIVDVIMTGTSDSDFVGYYRLYENGKPTNKWSSKFENQSRNKENFKTMISGVQEMLPQGHEYTEKTSISTDGLRIWNQQLSRGYELQYDNNGNLITNTVAINGDAIVNELGIDVNQGNFDNISVTNKKQFELVKKALLPYLKKFGLNENNIYWTNGTVEIDLPVLKNNKNNTQKETELKALEEQKGKEITLQEITPSGTGAVQTNETTPEETSYNQGEQITYGDNLQAEVVEDLGDEVSVKTNEGNEFIIPKTEINAKEQQNIQMRPEGEQEQAEGTSNSNMPEGNKAELQDGEKVKIAEEVGRIRKVKPKNVKGLLDVMSNIFGLNKEQSKAAATVGDAMIETMAKRAGVSKDEMYQRIAYAKAEMKDLPKGIKFQVYAWHGSPHQFDKFTTEKIGTGEGAQAFGWGLYFTDLESIARAYAKKLSGDEYSYDGKLISKNAYEYLDVVDESYGENFNEKTIKSLAKKAIDVINNDYIPDLIEIQQKAVSQRQREQTPFLIKRLESVVLELNDIIESKEIKKAINKNLYKVSLHKGKTPDQYTWLEWDKKVPKEIEGKLTSAINNSFEFTSYEKEYLLPVSSFDSVSGFYNMMSRFVGQKEASLFLLQAGIDGIKYPAESISRGATSDNARGFNYVVFDENAVSIEEVIKFQKDAVKARGAMMTAMDNNAIIYALTDPNVSTPLHELAHVYEHYLTDNERKAILEWAGHKEWTIETSEKFARGFEKYLAEGVAPKKELNAIFRRFKEWLTDIYNGIKDSEIDLELNDKMKSIYAEMLGTKAQDGKTDKKEALKKAKEELASVWEEYKSAQKNIGVKYDPKSSAELDVKLTKAIISYVKAQAIKTAEDVIKAVKDMIGISLTSEQANYLLEKTRPTKADIAEETEGLSNKEVIKQFVAEYEKSKSEEYKNKEAKLKEKVKLKAKEDKEARIIFKDFIKAALEELNISPTARTKVSKIATEAANVTARNLQSKVDAIIETLVRYELKQETNEIDALKRKIKKRISAGNFGNQTRAVNVILAIDKFDIPVKLIKQYNNLLSKLAANESEKSIDDINAVADFMQKWSEEIEKDLNDVEHLSAEYVAFKAKDKTSKKEFLEYLEEEKYTEDVITYADENFDRIKAKAKENTSNEKPTTEEKIEKIKKEKKEAVERFEEEMKALKDNKVEIDLDKYQDEKAKEIAATFKAITADNLIDLSARDIAMIPRIIDNISKGMMTPSAYRIAEKIEGSIEMNSFNDPKFKRAFINGQKVVVELAAALREFIDNRRADIIKDPKKLSDKFIKESLASFDNFVKGLKGNKIYEIINRYTSAKDVYITETNVFKNRINQLFYSAKGGEMYNNTLLSVYMRAREEVNNPNSKTIRKAIEYVNETLKGASNNEKKDVLSAIRDKFFDNGVPDMNAMKAEIDKNGLNKLIDYVDSMFEKNILPKAQFLSEVKRGKAFADIKGYSPRGTVRDADISSVEQRFNNIMSTKSGNIEERTGAVSELSFDYIGDVARAYSGITLEYHVGTELAAINNTLRLAKKVGTPDLVNLATALKTTIEADLRQQIDQSIREYSFLGRILQNMEANYTRSMLSGLIKALAETVTMMPKVALAYPKIFANAYSRKTDRVKSILDVIKSTHKDRAGLQSAEIVMFDSPLRRVATLRNLSIQEKVISTMFEKMPLVKSLNDSLKQLSIYPQRFADILVTTQVVVEAFAQEFEKITGKKLDEEALINDANYRAENQNAIKKARAYADQLGTKVANIGSRGEKAIADRDMSVINRAQGFMRSFPANEEVQFKSAVRTIVDSALERIGVENQRRGNFDSGRQAAGFIIGQLINQGGYFVLRQYLLNLFMNLLIGMFGGDEEEEFDFEDAAIRAFADMVMTNLFGRLRTVQKLAVGLAFNLGLKEMGAIGGDENPFYQMNISRYTYVPSLLRNFGAVGAVGAGVMEAMYKIMDASEGKDVKLSNKDKLKLMSLLFSVPAYQELYKAAIAKDKADESQSEEAPRAKRPSSGKKMSLPKLPKLPKLK